jgi:hypothetical protein
MAKKKKWTPPRDDIGNVWAFVQENYGRQPEARQRAIFNRLKKSGAEFGQDPTGLRSGMIRLTPEMVNRLPEGWGGEGVQNVGRAIPQYDQTKFEMSKNSAGRYFLRPITELTGLGPSQVEAIRQMDARSAAQQEAIKGAYNAVADTTAKEAQDLATRLSAIPGASAATGAPSSSAASTGAGVDQRLQDQNRTDQTLMATRAAADQALRAPVIRDMGISGATSYATQMQQARARALSDFSAGNAKAAADADTLNARLRGQDMTLMGAQLRTGAQVGMNNADNARAIATTQATVAQQERNSVRQAQTRLADIDARIKIAQQNNNTRLETSLLRERGRALGNQNQIIRQTIKLVQTSDPEGNAIPVARQRSQFVQMLVSQGVPRNAAIAAARASFK